MDALTARRALTLYLLGAGVAASPGLFTAFSVCREFERNSTLELLSKHERICDALLQLHIRTTGLEGSVSYALSTL